MNVLLRPRRVQSLLSATRLRHRHLATTVNSSFVNIVEVGPRDGLQNEKSIISVDNKVELINRLGLGGMKIIESGSFVSPKWVPQVCIPSYVHRYVLKLHSQMAGTQEVLSKMKKLPGVHYPVLVPNRKGLDNLLALLASSEAALTDEIAVFTAATEAFTKANTNCSIQESLDRIAEVTQLALEKGLRVRGYVSVVITCPYSGKANPHTVRDITKALLDMGCYEVSLGDTTGTGNPSTVGEMLEVVTGSIPVHKLAVRKFPVHYCHLLMNFHHPRGIL